MNRILVAILLVAAAGIALVLVNSRPGRATSPPAGERAIHAARAEAEPLVAASAADVALERVAVAPSERDERFAEKASVEGTASDGRMVRGRVVLPPGTPPDETIHVLVKRFTRNDLRVRAEADGSFAFADEPPGAWRWLDIDASYLFLPERMTSLRARSRGEIVLEPVLGGRIDGRVDGVEDRDLDESVVLLLDERGARELERVTLRHTRSFRMDALAPGPRRLVFRGAAHQEAPLELRIWPGATTTLELPVRFGAEVAGRVLDAAGTPLAGARVAAEGAVEARTDARGAFELVGVPPGPVELALARDGFRDHAVALGELVDGERRIGLELRLDRGRSIEGRLVWHDGEPASGGIVWDQADAPESATRKVSTAEDGSFRITGLGDAAVSIDAEGRRELAVDADSPSGRLLATRDEKARGHAYVERIFPDARGVVLVLRPLAKLEGRLRGDDGSTPQAFRIRGCRIVSLGGRDAKRDWFSRELARSDGGFVLDDLIPGRWELDFFADGYGSALNRRVVIPTAEPLEVVLRRRR